MYGRQPNAAGRLRFRLSKVQTYIKDLWGDELLTASVPTTGQVIVGGVVLGGAGSAGRGRSYTLGVGWRPRRVVSELCRHGRR